MSATPFLQDAGSPNFSSDSNAWKPVRTGRADENSTNPAQSGPVPWSKGGAAPAIRMPFEGSDSSDVAETDITASANTESGQRRHLRSASANSLQQIDEEDGPDDRVKESVKIAQDCSSRADVHSGRRSWVSVWILLLSVYSTLLSGIWLVVSIVQPRWGRTISSSGSLQPSTASLLTALLAKTVELSFATVFVAFIGQVLTRRAFVRQSQGMTLSEMLMRNWVVQPGSLITHGETLHYAALTVLGAITLIATVVTTFYTTASDAMVAPKLKFNGWEHRVMKSYIMSSYSNPFFVRDTCLTPLSSDPENPNYDADAESSCLDVQYSGSSYHNLLAFMATWHNINTNGTSEASDIGARPPGTASLFDNTTMTAAWIEADNSNATRSYEKYQRIINNVTLAMPHPGVYAAAVNPVNNILQPNELSGVGQYLIKASVVSPTVNVMCVNMAKEELAPLVYTEWPDATTEATGVPGQRIGFSGWEDEVPVASSTEWLNTTVVDDVFHWGQKYGRRPPVFQLYPLDANIITNTTVVDSDAVYALGKGRNLADYTLCELRSWTSPKCATHFNVSGTSGAQLRAHCEDPGDADSFQRSFPHAAAATSVDWKNMVDQWRLAIDLNGGVANSNASNARILTELILTRPRLEPLLPSMAEALAVLVSPTLVSGAWLTPFRETWDFPMHELGAPGVLQAFNASLMTQQYTSSHTSRWQGVFYAVLGLAFAINLLCLAYFLVRAGLVTDFTEPANLFALAVNSPPSDQLKGSCGGGAEKRDLVVPFRVSYAPDANHYFFEEANDRPWRGKFRHSIIEVPAPGGRTSSYNRLSGGSTWL